MKPKKENIKVIITDLDGTLLNSRHTISDYTKTVFRRLHDNDYLIIVATGRHHIDALWLLGTLGCPAYLVTSNGARVHSPNNELLHSANMQTDVVKSLVSIDLDPDITKVLFKETVCETSNHNSTLHDFQSNSLYVPQVVNFDEMEDFSVIKMLFMHDKHEVLLDVKRKIIALHPDGFNHSFSLPICLEIMDKSVDKSYAIKTILESRDISFSETISFGDGFNDEKMLLSAGTGLVMGNAPASLKQELSHLGVIATNDQDGVAKYLEEVLL